MLSSEETIFITFALVLFRNVLHAPERPPEAQQDQLVCNLFSQKFDGFLLKLLACPQRVSNSLNRLPASYKNIFPSEEKCRMPTPRGISFLSLENAFLSLKFEYN